MPAVASRFVTGAALASSLAVLSAAPTPRPDPEGRLTGTVRTHVVATKESLRSIGSRAGIDPAVIAQENGLKVGGVLAVGTELRLDNRHLVPPQLAARTIVINVPQRMLFYADEAGLLAVPVAVGSRGWRTPLGEFVVREKEVNPTWDVPASIAEEARRKGTILPAKVPPGPANPLGKHYLALSIGSVGIHGTNAPASIYQAVTHGCIRVHPDDIANLFARVDEGTPGLLVYEPVLVAFESGEVYLEVHPDVYRLGAPPLAAARELAANLGIAPLVDWIRAERVAAERHGLARSVSRR